MKDLILCGRCASDFNTVHGLEDHLRETDCGQILMEEALIEQEFRKLQLLREHPKTVKNKLKEKRLNFVINS